MFWVHYPSATLVFMKSIIMDSVCKNEEDVDSPRVYFLLPMKKILLWFCGRKQSDANF